MNEIIIQANSSKRMSSVEIAEMMGKKHMHVMRDIRALIDVGAINESNYGLVEYKDAKGEARPMYLLDFDATMTLITGYDAKRRSLVIKRWRELEQGTATPAYQIPKEKPATLLQVDKELRAAIRMAKAIGLKGNQAILSANQLAKKITGSDCLDLLETTHLITEGQERILTPTEIAPMVGFKSAVALNGLLQEMGLQVKQGKSWVPTDSGAKFAVLLDTGKKHKSSGAMVQQLKWKESIIRVLVPEATA